MPKVEVAAIQYEPAMFIQQTNLAELYKLAKHAADLGAKILVLPEMATTGFVWSSRQEIAQDVEAIPGPTTDLFTQLAHEKNCYVVIGLPEFDAQTGIYYNAAVCLGPSGIIGTYRKTHLFVTDPQWSGVGDQGLPVWDTEYGKLGLAIGSDLEFPEVVRTLALKGAQIIAAPCNWLGETCPSALWRTRALENQVVLVAANRWGWERGVVFSGGSSIIDGQGEVLAYRGSGNGVVRAEVTLSDHQDFLHQRQPSLYTQLFSSNYLWNGETVFGAHSARPLPPGKESQVGVVQMEVGLGKPEANRERVIHWVERCKEENPDLQLLVFPELVTTGYLPEKMADFAELIPGVTTTQFTQAAQTHGLYLAWGMAERDAQGRLYNTAVLVTPEGRIQRYRKIHLTDADATWAVPGCNLDTTMDTPIGRIALSLGSDLLFPEVGRCLATQGVDLLLVPSVLQEKNRPTLDPSKKQEAFISSVPDPYHWCISRIRAWENSLYLLVANPAGIDDERDGLNLSGIFKPTPYERCVPCTEVLATSSEAYLVQGISTSRGTKEGYRVRHKNNLRRRKTSEYTELLRLQDSIG